MEGFVSLLSLRNGAVFETTEGILAVKSEYFYETGQCQCVLLSSGEYAHFKNGNAEKVREVLVPLSPAAFARRMRACTGCAETKHMEADGVMEDLLESLGYKDGVEVSRAMNKWYE